MSEIPERTLSLVVDQEFDHPEGLVWDDARNRLLLVDVFAGAVVSYQPSTGVLETWAVGRPVGCVAPQCSGGLICQRSRGLRISFR